MLTTLETSHFEMSRLNDVAPWNIPDMCLTLDTSQPAMERCLSGLAQLSTARLSSAADRGEKPLCGRDEDKWHVGLCSESLGGRVTESKVKVCVKVGNEHLRTHEH